MADSEDQNKSEQRRVGGGGEDEVPRELAFSILKRVKVSAAAVWPPRTGGGPQRTKAKKAKTTTAATDMEVILLCCPRAQTLKDMSLRVLHTRGRK
jgi:hypothetical protein